MSFALRLKSTFVILTFDDESAFVYGFLQLISTPTRFPPVKYNGESCFKLSW
jgi:hypothetical protein